MTDSAVTPTDTEPTGAKFPAYPMSRAAGCPFDPPPALRTLQAEAPITKVRLWDGTTPWLVTRYDDQRALLADPRISADTIHPHYPFVSAGQAASRKQVQAFISMDDPEHGRLRRMVTAPFAIKRVEALRPAIQKIVDGLIDDMLANSTPVDLVEAFALPVPSLVICELLGVPYADHDFFQANSRILVKRTATPEQALAAQQRLLDYLDRLISEKLANPGNDLLSELAVQHVATGELSWHEAASMARLLLIAGHETTANMIALGTLALLQHPEQLAELRATDDPKLIAGAVEELLRHLSIVHTGRRRVALTDIEIGGRTIRAGEGVILANDIGNRDPAAFHDPDPDRLDLHRDARRHVAFGFGVHQCLGQPLARVELQVVYGTLYRRIPTLRLATGLGDLDQIPFKHDGLVYGVYRLPVTW
ncbi:cytochrome P450 [Pseudonocardia sp.]|uniref:cytochrome P450 n=1 Tax=Pseudonocardia sp. TaxID=60912 RepID=UPI0031FC4101